MVTHVYDPSAWKMETGRSGNWGRPWLQSEFRVSLGYLRPCFNKVGRGWEMSFNWQCWSWVHTLRSRKNAQGAISYHSRHIPLLHGLSLDLGLTTNSAGKQQAPAGYKLVPWSQACSVGAGIWTLHPREYRASALSRCTVSLVPSFSFPGYF